MLEFCVVCALVLGAVVAVTGASKAGERAGTLQYLALGDSYTIGETVSEAERWPVQLAGQLREAGLAVAEPKIIARTGWTTDELSAAMGESQLEGTWDLVSLLIGVNNQYRGRPVDNYSREFSELLDWAIHLAGHRPERVFVVSIPDWGVTAFAAGKDLDAAVVGAEIDAYNAVNRRVSEDRGVLWIDITDISRDHPELVASDGLHPSGAQYALWAERALPAVLELTTQR
jgi:lysophospholipase L1-like esterase